MFLVMRNMDVRETLALREENLLDDALRAVEALLPASWTLERDTQRLTRDTRVDEVVALTGAGGHTARYVVEARRSGTASGLLRSMLRDRAVASDLPLLYVSDYIGPSLREALAADGISYADGTGWVRVTSETPLILLTGYGAARSPRAGRPTAVARLNGIAASRIIRTLCAQDPPLPVRTLAAQAEVSPGSVSKLLPTLVDEGIVDRDEHRAVAAVRRRSLVSRWVQDYSYLRTNRSVRHFIAPRGVERTVLRLSEISTPVTVTASAAARRLLPEGITSVVPLRLLALYADDPTALADALGLLPADPATANTVIAAPQDRAVLTDSLAPAALVLADLLTLPGRGDAEAEQLMDALAWADAAWEE